MSAGPSTQDQVRRIVVGATPGMPDSERGELVKRLMAVFAETQLAQIEMCVRAAYDEVRDLVALLEERNGIE